MARWIGVARSRTGASRVSRDVRSLISRVRISLLTSRPSTKTRSPSSETSTEARWRRNASVSSTGSPARATLNASARYIAPVSIKR